MSLWVRGRSKSTVRIAVSSCLESWPCGSYAHRCSSKSSRWKLRWPMAERTSWHEDGEVHNTNGPQGYNTLHTLGHIRKYNSKSVHKTDKRDTMRTPCGHHHKLIIFDNLWILSQCLVPKTSQDKDLCPCHRSPCSSDANGYVGSQIICWTVVVHMVKANVALHLATVGKSLKAPTLVIQWFNWHQLTSTDILWILVETAISSRHLWQSGRPRNRLDCSFLWAWRHGSCGMNDWIILDHIGSIGTSLSFSPWQRFATALIAFLKPGPATWPCWHSSWSQRFPGKHLTQSGWAYAREKSFWPLEMHPDVRTHRSVCGQQLVSGWHRISDFLPCYHGSFLQKLTNLSFRLQVAFLNKQKHNQWHTCTLQAYTRGILVRQLFSWPLHTFVAFWRRRLAFLCIDHLNLSIFQHCISRKLLQLH